MKRLILFACCSIFLFCSCSKASYFQSTELVEEADNKQEANQQAVEDLIPKTIYVQVAGAVNKPDVYQLPEGSRVYAAIEAAGGLLDSADDSDINQAALLEDGQKLYIYTVDEATSLAAKAQAEEADDGLVNINTATVTELKTLPGIGESKANQIIAYRDANGSFSSIEDIKKVSGIGDGIFNQINSLIKI